MKGNSALDELFISYIAGELSAEDKALAEQYISSDDTIRKHVEELRKTWKLLAVTKQLDKIDVNREWNRFAQSITRKESRLTFIKREDETGSPVSAGDVNATRRSDLRWIAYAAVAACMLAVAVSGWIFYDKKEQTRAVYTAPLASEKVVPVLRHEMNTSGKPRAFLLQDGSQVILSDKSEISYHVPFDAARRDINLKGTADFSVAKDKARPFTVYSLDISTTALGTHFTVSAVEQAVYTTVRLMEGKVVVRSAATDRNGLAQEYYLTPGQLLTYNRKKKSVRVESFRNSQPATANGTQSGDELPDFADAKKGSWFMFNNQSLDQVFEQLSNLYHVPIQYSRHDVENLYFIGRYSKTDSLAAVLKQITTINNLKLTRQNDKFIIAK